MRVYKIEEWTEKGKPIHIFYSKNRDKNEPEHVHDFIEIVYIREGQAEHVIDGVTYEVGHGDILFMNYGSTHSFHTKGVFSYYNICFSPETVGSSLVTAENAFSLLSLTAFNEMCNESSGARLTFFGSERKEIEDILGAMNKERREKQTSYTRVMENYLDILITKMIRKTEVGMKQEELGDVWKMLSEYIDSNLGGELTLSSLARKCFYNPSYFSRVFKEKFKMSLVEYVTRKRLDHAIKLLCDSDLLIDEISMRVGFSDRSSFYRAFSKYIGGTPTDYRDEQLRLMRKNRDAK